MRPDNREAARALIASVQQLAQDAAQSLRVPPPEPDSYCGRGCAECVWSGYFDAVAYWQQEAQLMLGPCTTDHEAQIGSQ